MDVVLGLGLLLVALSYGYCLAAEPQRATPTARQVADWTYRQPLVLRVGIATVVWMAFMTGILFVAHGTG